MMLYGDVLEKKHGDRVQVETHGGRKGNRKGKVEGHDIERRRELSSFNCHPWFTFYQATFPLLDAVDFKFQIRAVWKRRLGGGSSYNVCLSEPLEQMSSSRSCFQLT